MLKIAITGASGRMGRALIEAVQSSAEIELTLATVSPSSSLVGSDAGEVAGQGKLGLLLTPHLRERSEERRVWK